MNLSIKELSQLWNCEIQLTEGIETNKLIIDHVHHFLIKQNIYNMPVIKANGLKASAGKAIFGNRKTQSHIRLHPALYDNADEVISQRLETFFHEVAHQIAYQTKRDHKHGPYWSYCLMHFGFSADRCYDGLKFNFRGYKKRNEHRGIEATVAILDDIEGFEL